jgi:dolichyl-phosphate beta-glucosyltransferase
MDFSIIIPALNEEKKINQDIEAAANFLVQSKLLGEIIVVDDGSTDQTSSVVKKSEIPQSLSLKVIRFDQHHGKGFAVRAGILDSCGDFIMFMDSGRNVPLSYIKSGLKLLQSDVCDIAMGSRHLPDSIIHKPLIWYRRVYSILFRMFVKFYLDIPNHLSDSQCGFKIYKRGIAHQLYEECVSEGFIFDVEIILRAKKYGYRMQEFAIEWTCDRDSRLSITATPIMIKELLRIKKILSFQES